MYRKMISTAALVAALAPAAAMAQSGWYVHGGVNATTVEQSTTRNTGTNEPNVGPAGGPSISTLAQDTGASFYVAGGYEFTPFQDAFIGIEAYYADETAETQNLNNVKVTDLELTSSYGVDVKLGKNVTDDFSVYGLLGLAQYEFDGTVSYTFAPPVDNISSEETAFVYGGGVELDLADRWSVITELRFTNDLEFDTPVDRGGIRSEDELDLFVIRSGLKYSF